MQMMAQQLQLQQQHQQATAAAQQQGQQQQYQNILAAQRLQQQQALQQQAQQQGTPQQQAQRLPSQPTSVGVGTPIANQLAGGIATPSPQAHQSPVTNAGVLGASPVAPRMQPVPSGGAGPGMSNAGTPGPSNGAAPPPNLSVFGDPKTLIAQMPDLLKMRQAGQMNPEMQKAVSIQTPSVLCRRHVRLPSGNYHTVISRKLPVQR